MGRRCIEAVAALLVASSAGFGDEVALTPQQLAQRIDKHLAAKWKADKVQPAPRASDAEFVRRVYLDLIGRIPRVSEVREFLRDPVPNKREQLIERLLSSPQYIPHWSNTWRDIILPAGGNQQATFLASQFRGWLEQQIRQNKPYDTMVRDLLAAPTGNAPQLVRAVALNNNPTSPLSFFQAQEFKAENLAASTARIFLGVRLECAQCHDHPFAQWSQTNFWELAAFYSGMQPLQRPVPGAPPPRGLQSPGKEIRIPGKDKLVSAKFPTGETPQWQTGKDARAVLAEWITSRDNPYFARTAANRLWGHCFGLGLHDPIDDEPSEENPVRHPELLAELTQQLIAHDFDLKYLLHAITLSEAYQRTSEQTHDSQKDTHAFARMPIRGLTPEQLFDSLAAATGYQGPVGAPNQPFIVFNDPSARGQFLSRFATQDRRTETQTSILQALALMNGRFISDATSLRTSATLAAVADVPFLSLDQKIETLYLAALSRPPRPEERDRLLAYVQRGGAQSDPGAALADVFWALLNTSEFLFNH
jgi:hypothetical protein